MEIGIFGKYGGEEVMKGLGSELVLNGSDFIDSNADGLADGWTKSANVTASIVSGNGFSGNAQRFAAVALSDQGLLGVLMVIGHSYNVSVKYRCTGVWRFYASNNGSAIKLIMPNNSGNAILFSTIYKKVGAGANISFYAAAAGYIEFDDLSIREVSEGLESSSVGGEILLG